MELDKTGSRDTPSQEQLATLTEEQAIEKLNEICKLPKLEYARRSKSLAKTLGVSKTELDKLRKERLAELHSADNLDSCDNELISGIEPYPKPVNGETLAASIQSELKKYCVMQEHAFVVIVLWIIAHYCIEQTRIFPKLLIKSPQKRCGKTTLLEVLDSLCNRTMVAANVSAAVIYRVIEHHHCTLLLDEADTWIHGNDEIRGIINSGNTRSTAFVWRVEGEDHEPRQFSTYAPMVLAMIADKPPPDTITDRSVQVELRRKTAGESVERMPLDLKRDNLKTRQKLKRWADDNGTELIGKSPKMPPIENDRALDNFTPLASVAELIGGEWPNKLNQAIVALDESSTEEETDIKVELLRDIGEIIGERVAVNQNQKSMFSSDLVSRLNNMEDQPWPECHNGRPLTQGKLASLLKPFAIRPKQIRISEKGKNGYEFDDFKDAIERYVPSSAEEHETAETTKQTAADSPALVSDSKNVSDVGETTTSDVDSDVSGKNETLAGSETEKPQQTAIVSGVSDVSVSDEPEKTHLPLNQNNVANF